MGKDGGLGQWNRSADCSDGLRIKVFPQSTGPALHTSVSLARGPKCRPVLRVGEVFDNAASSSMDSLDVLYPLSAGVCSLW